MPRMFRLGPDPEKGKTPMAPMARKPRRTVLGPDPAALPPIAVPGNPSPGKRPHWTAAWLVRGIAGIMVATFLFRVAVVTAKILIGIETVDSAGSILGYGSFIDDGASHVIELVRQSIHSPAPAGPAGPPSEVGTPGPVEPPAAEPVR